MADTIKSDGKLVSGPMSVSFTLDPVPVSIATASFIVGAPDEVDNSQVKLIAAYPYAISDAQASTLLGSGAQPTPRTNAIPEYFAKPGICESLRDVHPSMLVRQMATEILMQRDQLAAAERKCIRLEDELHLACLQHEGAATKWQAAELRADNMFERTKERCISIVMPHSASLAKLINDLTPEAPEQGGKEGK